MQAQHSTPGSPDGIVVIGAGPAGLTAAYELARSQRRPLVLEATDHVGGLARTADYRGYRFDMGGHRFFTKVPEVEKLWHEVLGGEFLLRPRLSRIYYRRRFFHYPLRAGNALLGLGLWESVRVVASYAWWQVFPHRQVDTFEQWVTNRFGRRLFQTFFETYTEKVWGIACSELKAEWAAQRIKDLSLGAALLNLVYRPRRTIRTLIEQFHYPRQGPGMLWRAVADEIAACGGAIRLESEVTRVHRRGRRVEAVTVRGPGGEATVQGDVFVSSMPLRTLVQVLDPPPPEAVLRAAGRLAYRDFLTVCLVVDRADLFPDNWIYIHDPEVKAGRIQNFKNWSPAMVPDPARTSLGLEYFCNEGDALWTMADADLVDLARREIEQIGLARASEVVDGCVFRVPKAYPVYDSAYREDLATVRSFVDGLDNLQTIGRNGLHRYDNQDHAMLTGLMAARNVVGGRRDDVWAVNTDPEYHEEVRIEDAAREAEAVLTDVFLKLDRRALGLALGALGGVLLALVTAVVAARADHPVAGLLGLLGQFFPGYRVSPGGIVTGAVYGFVTGFVGGWSYAVLRNATLFLSLALLRRRLERALLRGFLDAI